MTAPGYLSPEQVTQLLHAIKPSRVSKRDGLSHLEAYDVRAHLNRCFGFARWSADVIDSSLLYEDVVGEENARRVSCGWRVRMRLTVCSPDGTVLATYTEEATGDATNFPIKKRADAHDFGLKTAESQALKRCAINLGDQFGLSLYANGSTAAVVGGTFVGLPAAEEQDEQPASIDENAPAVVPEQQPTATEPATPPPPTLDELLMDAQQANSADALTSLARRAVAVHAAGHLADEALSVIKDVVTARRAELADKAKERAA